MKNINKFIAIVLCLLLVTISFVTVSAEEGEFSGIVSEQVEVLGNGDVEVSIDIAGNPGIMALILEVSYDSEVLTLKENGFTDTGLLVGNIDTTLTKNPFRLGWQHCDGTSVNNYQNGSIAKLTFEVKEGFTGKTDVEITIFEAQTIIKDIFVLVTDMENGVISITKPKFALKDGAAFANGLDGETLVIASYDGDRMIDCKMYPNSVGDVKIQVADAIDTSSATKIKAFLWENSETLAPECEFAEEEL